MKPLLIGEAPGKHNDGLPLRGRIGKRLAAMSGLTLDQLDRRTERINLLPNWPGKSPGGHGAAFPMRQAIFAALRLSIKFEKQDRAVLLFGKRVGRAFALHGPYFTYYKWGRAVVVVLPHPSGVNRWYNVPKNRRKMAWFMKKLLGGT